MYRFNFHGILCECETMDELRAAVGDNGKARPRKASKPRRAKVKAKPTREGVKASWDVAKRTAKRLGRTDVMNVRSEIRAGTIKDE